MTKKPQYPPRTWLEDPDGLRILRESDEYPFELAPDDPYVLPSDVPLPTQQKIREAHQAGVPTADLARLFSLPEDWVKIYCLKNTT